jgi:hypothetical protein
MGDQRFSRSRRRLTQERRDSIKQLKMHENLITELAIARLLCLLAID